MVQLQHKKLMMDKELAADHHNQQTGKLMQRSEKSIKYEMMEKLNDVKEMIDRHINDMHSTVSTNTRQTVSFLQKLQKKAASKTKAPKPTNRVPISDESDEKPAGKVNPTLLALLEIWKQLQPPRSRKRQDTSFSIESDEQSNESGNKTAVKDLVIIKTTKEPVKEQVCRIFGTVNSKVEHG